MMKEAGMSMLIGSKVLTALSIIALCFGVLTGCSSNEGSIVNTNDPTESTISILIDNQIEQDGIRAVAANIEEKFHIKTEIETRPSGAKGHEVIKTRLAAGDMADLVFYNSGSLLQALNPEQYFVDLTDEPFMENVYDSFKKSVMVNNKVFGLPFGNALAGGWLYNKKVYRELGLSVPKTWNELIVNSDKIKAAGKTAVIGTYKDDWTSQLIVLADNHNVIAHNPTFAEDLAANKAKFATTPAALRSFEKLSEVYQKGYLNSDFITASYKDGVKLLVDGTGVQYPMTSGILSLIKRDYPDNINDIGFFPQPGDNPDTNGMTVFMPAAIYLNKNTQNLEAAKQWLAYFASPEGVKTFHSKKIIVGPLAIKGMKVPNNIIPAVEDMLPYFESGKNTPALENIIPLKGPNLPQITTQVGSGKISAKTGAELYDQDLEKQAKELGLTGW
jgi:raffinose/stachyose/melibiose transport system substrate-binding protein